MSYLFENIFNQINRQYKGETGEVPRGKERKGAVKRVRWSWVQRRVGEGGTCLGITAEIENLGNWRGGAAWAIKIWGLDHSIDKETRASLISLVAGTADTWNAQAQRGSTAKYWRELQRGLRWLHRETWAWLGLFGLKVIVIVGVSSVVCDLQVDELIEVRLWFCLQGDEFTQR